MQKYAPAWVLLSVVVAVVLWGFATMLENRLRGSEEPPPADTSMPERGVESPPRDAVSSAGDCAAFEGRLKRVIDGARSCQVDDDCTLFDYGYPMDCMTSVAKSQVPLLREEYRQYDQVCEFRVFYDCPTEPYVRLALCRNNRCVVELDRSEDLQERTLDQLNRQQE